MKLSLDWIRDYVELPGDFPLTRLAYDLTMSTVEVEDVIELGRRFDNMLVGVVKEILPHPNADKLILCQTDLGNGEMREIVCGGINVKQGMKAAVARPGAMVRWHGEGEPIELGVAKVRGVESYGMICSSSEIGLFDLFPFEEEATIIDLSAFGAEAGTPLADALGLNDVILEIDNKSLTNRPDLWGHYGIAREIAALYNLELKEFEPFEPPATPEFTVVIEDTMRCPRYTGVKMEGLSTIPAPFEMQSRIWRVGMRPANAIVDVTNYVMLATGQPTHAFDADRIQGHITVRRARASGDNSQLSAVSGQETGQELSQEQWDRCADAEEDRRDDTGACVSDGEKLILLNGKELTLSGDDLVIADDVEAVALAGVMGGSKDSVLENTRSVILEIANFDALATRRTAAKFETRTESATRYEKAIDPERGDIALSLAMQLYAGLFPDMQITGFCDNYPNKLKNSEVDVSLGWLEKRLGKRIPDSEIAEKLRRLGFKVSIDSDNMHTVAPTWRSTGDITIADDIMEEVARMHGFENFEPMPIITAFEGAINQQDVDIERKIKEYYAFRCGMREIFTYPWMHDDYINAIYPGKDDMLAIESPPSHNEHYLRSSLLPNLCKAVEGNLRFYSEFSIFESAQVFFNRDFRADFDKRESLPLQQRHIAGAFVGNPSSVDMLFRKAKGTIEALPRYTHIEPLSFERSEKPVWADDVLWLNITDGEQQVGSLALLSKKAAIGCGIKNSAVMMFELNIELLKPLPSRTNVFARLPEYPTTDYDISLLFDAAVKWDEINAVITGVSHELLQSVSFVGEYKGKQIPESKKSITCRLVIGSLSKTLTSDEIEKCAGTVIKRLGKKLGAEMRTV